MRNRKPPVTNLGDASIIIRIPISFEVLDNKGLLGWRVGTSSISSPIRRSTSLKLLQDAVKSLPKEFSPSEHGEIVIELPISYESTGNGKLGWKSGVLTISSPASRDTTISFIRNTLEKLRF